MVAMVDAPVTTNRTSLTAGAVAWLVGGVGYLVAEALAASTTNGPYSYTHKYISALGVPAWTPLANLMNGAFCMQGAMFFIAAVMVCRAVGRRGMTFLVLSAVTALGNFLVATVHGGSPLAEGGGMKWHVLGASMAFFAGNAAIVAGSSMVARAVDVGWWYRAVSLLIAVAGFIALALLMNYNVWTFKYLPVGLVERAAVYSIIGWQMFSAVLLLWRPAGCR